MESRINVNDVYVNLKWRVVDGKVFVEASKVFDRKETLRRVLSSPELLIVKSNYN